MASTQFYISDPAQTSQEIKESIVFYLTKIIKLISLNLNNDSYRNLEHFDIMPICELLNSLCIGLEAIFFHGLSGHSSDNRLNTTNNFSAVNEDTNQYHINICNISFWPIAKLLVNYSFNIQKIDIPKEYCETLNNELFNFAIITDNYKILEHIAKYGAFMNVNEKIKMFEDILSPHILGKSWIRFCINNGILLKNLLILYTTLPNDVNEADKHNLCTGRENILTTTQNELGTEDAILRNFTKHIISDDTSPNQMSKLKMALSQIYLPHAYIRDKQFLGQLVKLLSSLPLFPNTDVSPKLFAINFPKLDMLSPILYYPTELFFKDFNVLQSKLSTASLIVAGYRPYYKEKSKDFIRPNDALLKNMYLPFENLNIGVDSEKLQKQVLDGVGTKFCYDQDLGEYIPVGEELDEDNFMEEPSAVPTNNKCEILGVGGLPHVNETQPVTNQTRAVVGKGPPRKVVVAKIKNPVIAEILENQFSKMTIDTAVLDELAGRWKKYLPAPDDYSTRSNPSTDASMPLTYGRCREVIIGDSRPADFDAIGSKGEGGSVDGTVMTTSQIDRDGLTHSHLKESWSSPALVTQVKSPDLSPWSLISDTKSIPSTRNGDKDVDDPLTGRTTYDVVAYDIRGRGVGDFEKLKVDEATTVDDNAEPRGPYPPIEGTLASLYYEIMLKNHPSILRHASSLGVQRFLSSYDTVQNEKGLDLQGDLCAGQECGKPIGFGSDYRVCHYDGLYYCTKCHWNESSTIPARIIHNWDFKLYKVCHQDKGLLETSYNDPLVRLPRAWPLYALIRDLEDVRDLKRALHRLYNLYLSSCSLRTAHKFLKNRHQIGDFVTAIFSSRTDHVSDSGYHRVLDQTVSPEDLYSVADLVRRPNNYKKSLADVLQSVESHVTCCPHCSIKRLLCIECHGNVTPKPLPPRDSDVKGHNGPISSRVRNLIDPTCHECRTKTSRSNFYVTNS